MLFLLWWFLLPSLPCLQLLLRVLQFQLLLMKNQIVYLMNHLFLGSFIPLEGLGASHNICKKQNPLKLLYRNVYNTFITHLKIIFKKIIRPIPPINPVISIGDVKQLVSCCFFTVWHGVVNNELVINQNRPFLLCSIISGECKLDTNIFKKGDHFIIPCNFGRAHFLGNAEIIFSSI